MLNMLTNIGFTCIVQLTKLLLRQPSGIARKSNINVSSAVLALINYNLIVIFHIQRYS